MEDIAILQSKINELRALYSNDADAPKAAPVKRVRKTAAPFTAPEPAPVAEPPRAKKQLSTKQLEILQAGREKRMSMLKGKHTPPAPQAPAAVAAPSKKPVIVKRSAPIVIQKQPVISRNQLVYF